jgi:hypothetical protein
MAWTGRRAMRKNLVNLSAPEYCKKEFFRKDDAFNLALEPCEDVTTAD